MSAPRRRRRLWTGRRLLFALVAAMAINGMLERRVLAVTEIRSPSMSPTLEGDDDGGDLVLIDRWSYRDGDPARGDVVAFHDADGLPVMKRAVGLPGEEISIEGGRVLVDGQPHGVARIDAHEYSADGHLRHGPITTRSDRYFVLGDDTGDSWDSRYWGGLERDRIYGRAVWILWPPERFGPVR